MSNPEDECSSRPCSDESSKSSSSAATIPNQDSNSNIPEELQVEKAQSADADNALYDEDDESEIFARNLNGIILQVKFTAIN